MRAGADDAVRQHRAERKDFLSVANDALNGLLRYGDWQELTKDGVLRTVVGKSDYPIASFCPDFISF